MPRSITTDSVVTVLSAISQVAGDRVYERPDGPDGRCLYTHDGKPSCIVAQVVAAHGYNTGILEENIRPMVALPKADITAEIKAQRILQDAQYEQDSNAPWRDSVTEAFAANGNPEKAPRPMTLDSVVSTLSAIARVAGDTVYQRPANANGRCVYTDPDTKGPSCIVGQVIAAHGYDNTLCGEGHGPISALNNVGVKVESRDDFLMVEVLTDAQELQDAGETWRDSVARSFHRNGIKEFPNV